uniref:CCHC-type domain-containing protein n=1 Tax=Tanacetum cinerariifolium TaxID=118510 RepID=A0A6L2KID4_TANCI|nr:hypothetical protein [Tanacetum cinerariifolium]
MDPYNHSTPIFIKLPILDTGKFEQWKFIIQPYLQHEHYALWEVIEFGDSYKAPPEETAKDKGLAGEVSATTKKKGRTVAITAKDIQKRKKDVNARTTLLLALPDEHQLRFSKYNSAKELWEAILKTFGGNEATKKTKKNKLKQQYGKFKADGSETLEQTFNRLQAIVSHIEFIDVPIEQDDLNQKFLTSLALEWLVQKRVGSNSENMAFISSSNTSSGKSKVLTVQGVSTASAKVSTDTTDVAAASLSYDTVCAFIATQPNGSQIKYEDISQIDAGFDKSKVKCFNCHKMGHFARECRSPRSLDRGKRESYKKDPKVEEPAPKAMIAIDGIGWDWSYMAEEDETLKNHALMADKEEVPTEYDLMVKSSLSSDNESPERDIKLKDNIIEYLRNELEEVKKEKESIDFKIENFENASKDLDRLLRSQKLDKDKKGVGFNEYRAIPPPPAQVYSPPKKISVLDGFT